MTQIEVIAIGDEVLTGFTVNGNAAFISQKLFQVGYSVASHRVLPDAKAPLQRGLSEALDRFDVVICSGGLGPTEDDRTRQIVANLIGCDFRYDEEVAKRLQERWGPDHPTLRDQATIPSAATPIHNLIGTAPGLLFDWKGKLLCLLPGVPFEMQAMLIDEVIPFIQRRFPLPRGRYTSEVRFFQVPESALDVEVRALAKHHPEVTFGIYPGPALVSVRLTSETGQEVVDELVDSLQRTFRRQSYPAELGSLEAALHHRLTAEQRTLATAESCTGGALAATFTKMAGASEYFLGGIIAYADEVKQQALGVAEQTLIDHGAVSEAVVKEMAEGALQVTGADFSLATSGIAGPSGGTVEKPVGTVCLGVGVKGEEPEVFTLHLQGNRPFIIAQTITHALAELWKRLP